MHRFSIHRFAMLGVSCALLAGCGLPPSLQFASLAVDGFSYLTSNKTVADHGLSALSGQDCKMMRVASAVPVCQERTPGVDFDGNLDHHAARISINLPACMTARLAESLADTGPGTGADTGPGSRVLNGCAEALVKKFGSDGALNFADARILALIDAGRVDDAGLWYGVQANVRTLAHAG